MSRQRFRERAGSSPFSVPGAGIRNAVPRRAEASVADAWHVEAERVDHARGRVAPGRAPATVRPACQSNRSGETLFGVLKMEQLYGQCFLTRQRAQNGGHVRLPRLHSTWNCVEPVSVRNALPDPSSVDSHPMTKINDMKSGQGHFVMTLLAPAARFHAS